MVIDLLRVGLVSSLDRRVRHGRRQGLCNLTQGLHRLERLPYYPNASKVLSFFYETLIGGAYVDSELALGCSP